MQRRNGSPQGKIAAALLSIGPQVPFEDLGRPLRHKQSGMPRLLGSSMVCIIQIKRAKGIRLGMKMIPSASSGCIPKPLGGRSSLCWQRRSLVEISATDSTDSQTLPLPACLFSLRNRCQGFPETGRQRAPTDRAREDTQRWLVSWHSRGKTYAQSETRRQAQETGRQHQKPHPAPGLFHTMAVTTLPSWRVPLWLVR